MSARLSYGVLQHNNKNKFAAVSSSPRKWHGAQECICNRVYVRSVMWRVFRQQWKYFCDSVAPSTNTRSILRTTRIDYVSGFKCPVLGTVNEIFSRPFIQFRDEKEHPKNKALSQNASRPAALIVRFCLKTAKRESRNFHLLGRGGNVTKPEVKFQNL